MADIDYQYFAGKEYYDREMEEVLGTSTPVTSEDINKNCAVTSGKENDDDQKIISTRKRNASKSLGVDSNSGTRSGHRKFARDNSKE